MPCEEWRRPPCVNAAMHAAEQANFPLCSGISLSAARLGQAGPRQPCPLMYPGQETARPARCAEGRSLTFTPITPKPSPLPCPLSPLIHVNAAPPNPKSASLLHFTPRSHVSPHSTPSSKPSCKVYCRESVGLAFLDWPCEDPTGPGLPWP